MKTGNKRLYKKLLRDLSQEKVNLIILKGGDTIRFSMPGVKALMTFLTADPDYLKETIIFDKVVGKSAAALMALGGVKEIFANVISEHAIKLLETNQIKFNFKKRVPLIENKSRTGFCPIELLSIQTESPKEIYLKLYDYYSGSFSTDKAEN